MTYQSSAGDARTTMQHRAATAPTPSNHPFSAIPPSLIPGHRHHTFSATGTNTLTNGLLCFGPSMSSGINSAVKAPAAAYTPGGDTRDYFSMNPSPYRDFQSQPLPPPLPMPQSLLPQPVVPPLPPKTPIITSPTSPTLPPKPPPFMPPPNFLPPAVLPRSRSQPAPRMPRRASTPPPPPPPPPLPTLPPKPLGARSPSLAAIRRPGPHPPTQPNVSPSAKPSSIMQEPNDTTLPTSLSSSEKSPVEDSQGINEEQELKLALELSAQTERERAKALLVAQDEDLARAVEQSLIDSAPRPGPSGSRPGPSTLDKENAPSSSSTIPRDAHPRSQKPVSRKVTLLQVDVQLKEDEELARKLEAEYDRTPSPETNQIVDPKPSGSRLPRYADVVSKETAPVNRLESDPPASPHVPQAQLNSARSRERLNPDQANTHRRNSPSPAQRTSPRPESQTPTAPQIEAEAPEHTPPSPQPPRPVVTPNQFVEPELLYGASFGNHIPPVENVQYRGGLPNVIALPYGRCHPMHIRASSWRQLLKLLGKLGANQIEPTVEARAETKGALLLRTVIQFFKPHASSTSWRTVIYLTIDYPPPPRYTSGVANSLPYSYSLSTLPALLRDGPDSTLSKYYTIPATTRTPLPKLPVSMSDMAMYLAAALEDSRLARDSSIGHHRLAKMINQFCPEQRARAAAGDEEAEPRRRGRALIGRLMGRQSRPRQAGGHNADMYDVVTPFVSEWG